MPSETFRAFWEERVAATPDATFLIHGDDSWTYAAFDAWATSLAAGMSAVGIGEGTRAALLLPSEPALLRLQVALQKLGAVWVPAIPGSTYDEIQYVLGHSRASVLFTDADHWSMLTAGGVPEGRPTWLVDGRAPGASPLDELDRSALRVPPLVGIHGRSVASIMYTSGSTGKPKGVMNPAQALPVAGRTMAERTGATAADVWYCTLPLFHAAAFITICPAIATGAPVVLRAKFSRRGFWEDVRRHGCTATMLMPSSVAMLLTDPRAPDDADNPLRLLIGHVVDNEFEQRFGVDICTVWTSTETLGAGAMASPDFARESPQQIGPIIPADAEVRAVGADGQALPPGHDGELCVRHSNVMLGYLDDPTNTAATLQDGWVHTGDLGSVDEHGTVSYAGRIKNVIKRSGENIAGEEVELALVSHPAVQECVVCGVSDPLRTEEVHATVVVTAHVTEDELAGWCRERLSDWKVPRYLTLTRDELPRLANGKIDRARVTAAADAGASWDRTDAAEPTSKETRA